MTILSYLNGLSSELNLKESEKEKIRKSIETLQNRLVRYFGNGVKEHFIFGSYTRQTILPRKADPSSDIDYIVIFENPQNHKPQTLLNQLKRFVETYYSQSDIRQSSPTIVLELNHIKFELVPAKKDWWGTISIPSPASSFTEWMATDPKGFNEKLTAANQRYFYGIKPTVRLLKYWNRENGGYLDSYKLEQQIANLYYWNCSNLRDLVYVAIDNLSYTYADAQDFRRKVDRAKEIARSAKKLESAGYPRSAEEEIQKLFPKL